MANSLTSSGITLGDTSVGTSTFSKIVDFTGGGSYTLEVAL